MQPYFFAFCFENFYNFDFIPMKCSLQGVLEVFFKNYKKNVFSSGTSFEGFKGHVAKTVIIYLKIDKYFVKQHG